MGALSDLVSCIVGHEESNSWVYYLQFVPDSVHFFHFKNPYFLLQKIWGFIEFGYNVMVVGLCHVGFDRVRAWDKSTVNHTVIHWSWLMTETQKKQTAAAAAHG